MTKMWLVIAPSDAGCYALPIGIFDSFEKAEAAKMEADEQSSAFTFKVEEYELNYSDYTNKKYN